MEIQIFNNEEFGQVRCQNIDGEPWFVGKDVAEALGYSNSRDAIIKHVDKDDKTTVAICDTGSNYKSQAVIINESGLYSLIFSSKLESARKFKRWVTSEVLPQIRRHGMFMTDEVLERFYDDPDYGISLMNTLKAERKARLEAEAQRAMLIHKVEDMKPTNEYCKRILRSQGTVTVTQIAQDYGMSAITFNEMLRDMNIQYYQNKQWILYAKYKDMGYVRSYTETYVRHDGKTGNAVATRWTQRGRLFLFEKLLGCGIVPKCEEIPMHG